MNAIRLRGARVATGPEISWPMDVCVENGLLRFDDPRCDQELDLSGLLLLPGLVNAHDHLEFNLFPRLGRRIYSNAGEWAADIYRPDDSPVREHAAVPKPVRLAWGAIKNLLSGVTTVAHHNPYDAPTFDNNFPIRVVKRFGWAHSLGFNTDLQQRFAQTPHDAPFILHAAEGIDAQARSEIHRLDELGLLGKRTVLVHANAAGLDDYELLRSRGCSLIWCPSSNLATYGRTLSPEIVRSGIAVALGTDSAISAGVNLQDEIRVARHYGMTADEIYRMVTSQAASILRLQNGEGSIRHRGVADLVAVKFQGQTPSEAIFDLHPELVMVAGHIKLAAERFSCFDLPLIALENHRWKIDADIARLNAAVVRTVGPDFRLAGKLVTV